MALTYEQFKSKVPEETATFVYNVLPYLDRYVRRDNYLKFENIDMKTNNPYSQTFFLLLYGLENQKEYGIFLKQHGFDSSKYKIDFSVEQPENRELMFERWNKVFNIYQDETQYSGLFPLEIVKKAMIEYNKNCNNNIFNYLFPSVKYNSFKKDLERVLETKKGELETKIEEDIYGEDLPISVISYFDTATKIRAILFSQLSNKHELIKLTDKDIVPLSLFIALYFYSDTSMADNLQFTEQSMIQSMLKEKGITFSALLDVLNIDLNGKIVEDTSKNIYALSPLYVKYFRGENEVQDDSKMTVSKILERVFDRNFTNSFAIERLFAKLNCDIRAFIPVEEKIEKLKEEKERELFMSSVKFFYKDLSKETKDFMEFTGKIYLLILEKMKEKTHNMDVLSKEEDADTLALYIASCYYDANISRFFNDYGITLEKVLEFLNLQITREEIEAMELDQKILVDRYKRFVYEGVNEGVNQNKSARTIYINDIAYNLCNREFTRSMIMENIFSALTNSIHLESDFLNQLKEHLEGKEEMRKMRLIQHLFKDMPSTTIRYLENVSIIHQYLIDITKGYSETDIQVFSLLLGIFTSTEKDIVGFLESKKITGDSVCAYLNVSYDELLKENVDIDLLNNRYGEFIFGGHNKNLERKDLTISNIAENIFSKSVYNSVLISKFLGYFGLSYEDFEHLDEKVQSYLEETVNAKKVSDGQSLLESFNESTKKYIENVIRIHQRLIVAAYQNEAVASFIPNLVDVRELSLLLGMFTVQNDVQYFFEKNKITLKNVCSMIGLDFNFLSNLESEDINYRLVIDVYEPVISYDNSNVNKSVSDLVSRMFDSTKEKESFILEEIASFVGANYDILKEEVKTKRDYELSLSIDDRIKLLSEESTDVSNLSDVKSILQFGNSLSIHSKYIHDELAKIILSDAHDKSVEAINSIADKIYTKTPIETKPISFWKRLFTVSVEENPKVVLNQDAIQELKEAIDINIEALSKELLGYDAIRRYIEVYRRKNRSHLIVVMSEIEHLETEIQSLNPENEEEYASYLTATSRLQIMRDKQNRFSTSNHLMKQELFKVNQAIVNHFITINALEMARDDLLPLIGSELALTQGRSTENQGLDLSANMIELFQSLLSRNVTSAIENIEKLKQSSLSSETFSLLNKDIEVYLRGLNQAREIGKRVEVLDIDQMTLSVDDSSKSDLTGEATIVSSKPKQKVIEYPK